MLPLVVITEIQGIVKEMRAVTEKIADEQNLMTPDLVSMCKIALDKESSVRKMALRLQKSASAVTTKSEQ